MFHTHSHASGWPATCYADPAENPQSFSSGDLLRRGAQRLLNELKPPPATLFDSGLMTSGRTTADIDISGLKQLWLVIEDVDSHDRDHVIAGWPEAELVGPDGQSRLDDLKTDARVQKRPMRVGVRRPIGTVEGETKYETTYYDYPEALAAPVPSLVGYDVAGKGYKRFRDTAGIDKSSVRNEIDPRIRFLCDTAVFRCWTLNRRHYPMKDIDFFTPAAP